MWCDDEEDDENDNLMCYEGRMQSISTEIILNH